MGIYARVACSQARTPVPSATHTTPNVDAQAGVLKSLCDAIGATLDEDLPPEMGRPRAVIASAAIQAFKRHDGRLDADTLDHLTSTFGAAYNKKTGKLIPARIAALARRIRWLVYMVDEVTGDDAGVPFFHKLAKVSAATRSLELESRRARGHLYYVAPIPVLVNQDNTSAYCRTLQAEKRDEEAQWLKEVMVTLFRDALGYPLDTKPLPYSDYFRDFPFLIVASQDLAALRHGIFDQGRLLMSREMNLLSMILAEV